MSVQADESAEPIIISYFDSDSLFFHGWYESSFTSNPKNWPKNLDGMLKGALGHLQAIDDDKWKTISIPFTFTVSYGGESVEFEYNPRAKFERNF